jgi:hypothetical protein
VSSNSSISVWEQDDAADDWLNSRIPAEHVVILQRAVGLALDHANSQSTPRDRARAQAGLLGLLQDLVISVTAARDTALAELLLSQPGASNRALAKQLNLSRQRVDQLKRHIRAGGRRPTS